VERGHRSRETIVGSRTILLRIWDETRTSLRHIRYRDNHLPRTRVNGFCFSRDGQYISSDDTIKNLGILLLLQKFLLSSVTQELDSAATRPTSHILSVLSSLTVTICLLKERTLRHVQLLRDRRDTLWSSSVG